METENLRDGQGDPRLLSDEKPGKGKSSKDQREGQGWERGGGRVVKMEDLEMANLY